MDFHLKLVSNTELATLEDYLVKKSNELLLIRANKLITVATRIALLNWLRWERLSSGIVNYGMSWVCACFKLVYNKERPVHVEKGGD